MELKQKRPNIILMLSDDSGWGDLSCKGNKNIYTPNLDKLAGQSADFDWFYVAPLCAPTRAEVLTGRWFPRTGVKGVTRRAECLNLDETTIGDLFQGAGYRTGYFGKWHSGSAYPYHPNGRGFEEFTGFCCGHWSHYFDSTLEHNGTEFKADGYITDVLTDSAVEYIEERAKADEPFFCYLAYNVPHCPFQVPDEWYDRVRNREITMRNRNPEEEDLAKTKAVLAMCENLDWNVGKVMDTVERLGIEEETIIIYLTDNGPNTARWNGGMRGRKGHVDEGGVRTMFFMQWKGMIEAGMRVDRIAGAVDLVPTLADLAGIDGSTEKPLDGVSLKPL
ncbi:MAG: sulfatase-like hydrolase/transferase, partial [Spirochaetales bacterium]|nr:sulfatase-like hydrolase/transferase [Spirochaetales bacterium]